MASQGLSRISFMLVGLLLAATALAQQAAPVTRKSLGSVPVRPSPNQVVGHPNFGTQDLTYIRFNGIEFYPYQGTVSYSSVGNLRSATALQGLEANLHVPTGAIIDYIELDACDTNASVDMQLTVFECDPFGSALCVPATSVTTTGATGCQTVSISGVGYTVDNALHALGFEAFDNAGDGSLAVASAVVGYRLQVSPAPGSPTFTDVPTDSIYFQFIEALAASGITAGCLPGPQYCPDRPITRAEMAVFMAKALGLHFPN